MRSRIYGAMVRMGIFCLCLAVNFAAHAGDRGAVTAIASLNAQTSAFIGFATGDVLYCARLSGCTALDGTPKSAVTAIDTPREGDNVMVWVGYEDGAIYFCTLTGGCSIQEQKLSERLTNGPSPGNRRVK